MERKVRRVGIVGFGGLGKYLVEGIQKQEGLEIAFIWNRSPEAVENSDFRHLALTDLNDFAQRKADLIVEVAHPLVVKEFGRKFLAEADLMVGSPTAFADASVEHELRQIANTGCHGLYLPSGAMWGVQDIAKMADRGSLKDLKITMKKHPSSLKLVGPLHETNAAITDSPVILFDGSVRGLCPLAPNNVNTMAVGALAASNLGFDRVKGCLISDPSLESHIIEIDVTGPEVSPGESFTVKTVRYNPAAPGKVTGSATFASFLSSLLAAHSRGSGVHFC